MPVHSPPTGPPLVALLGPTNTGKTHRAVERLLEHRTGMIGLPLRLLAREVYDTLTVRAGEQAVALVTGEEKRVPAAPRYWVCTVEAMPLDRTVDFLAVDEIQLAAHPERGHVFTDRLLHARGRRETWFLGSSTVRGMVAALVPDVTVRGHTRLSTLRHRGRLKVGGLPPRSAVVAFSMARVYDLAERVRARRGGAAVVLGALSPRARNAQVALYQSGEVDYLVATDAIGMGLNLDVDHVAFAELTKFDGRTSRSLDLVELGQIAGRAGRHLNDGTFGALAPMDDLAPRVVRAVESHRFPRRPERDVAQPRARLLGPRRPHRLAPPAAGPARAAAGDARRRPRRPLRPRPRPRRPRPRARRAGGPAAVGRLPDSRLPAARARGPRGAARRRLPPVDGPVGPALRRLARGAHRPPRPDRRGRRRPAHAARVHPHLDVHRAPPRLGRRPRPLAGAHAGHRGPAERRPARATGGAIRRSAPQRPPGGPLPGRRRAPRRRPVRGPRPARARRVLCVRAARGLARAAHRRAARAHRDRRGGAHPFRGKAGRTPGTGRRPPPSERGGVRRRDPLPGTSPTRREAPGGGGP